jgi:hypothetical protein
MVKQEEEIKVIAYRLWEKEGRPSGKELEHYFRAEAIYEHQHRRADTSKTVQPPVVDTLIAPAQPASGEGSEPHSGHHRAGHHRRRKGEHHHGNQGNG